MRKLMIDEGPLSKRLGDNLAAYRKAKNHTQKSLAQVMGVDKETISRMERGVVIPTLPMLEKLGGELQVSVVELIGKEEAPVDITGLLITEWLSGLDEEDRQYVCNLVKGLCERLQKRKVRVEKRKQETRPWSTRSAAPQGK